MNGKFGMTWNVQPMNCYKI